MAKVKSKVSLVEIDGAAAASMAQVAQQFLGQPVAVLCARYNYRGILSHVGEDCLRSRRRVRLKPLALLARRPPNTEDPIGSSVIISLGAVEIIYQPRWCFAPLDA